jgi:hypothetical protein
MKDLETMAANLKHAARNGGASIGGGEFTPEECRRVARMLDAAPDLLEALEAVIGHDAHLLPNPWRIEAARAAIVKARGNAPD